METSWKAVGVAVPTAALVGAGVAMLVFKAEEVLRRPVQSPATETTPFPRSIPVVK